MKKGIIILVAVIFSLGAYAQQPADILPHVSNSSWAIKGKALPWTAFICSGVNYTLGIEYGFNKRNSIGVDFVYNDYSFTHDVYDSTTHEDKSGPRRFSVNRGFFVNYRRYVSTDGTWLKRQMDRVLPSGSLVYVSPFFRYGKNDYHYQEGYATSQIKYDEWQYSSGVLVGFVTSYFDLNAGPFYKQMYIQDVQMEQTTVTYSRVRSGFGFRVGANLYLIVKKKGNHCLSKYAEVQRKSI